MAIQTFLISALHESLFQVRQVLAGLPEDAWDDRLVPVAMSPRETVEHLCHVTHAFLETAKNGSFSWETPYSTGLTEAEDLMNRLVEMRAEAEAIVQNASADDGKIFAVAQAFLTQHDAYHVGQLAQFRLNRNDGWDPYSIYPHE